MSNQWIFLEGMGCTSGEPDIYRLANIGHGYVETVSAILSFVGHSTDNLIAGCSTPVGSVRIAL
jgi:hypothetical protein